MSAVVPVIDIAGWFSGDPLERRRIAAALDDSCRNTGFQQIVGHGVDPALCAAVKDVADEFFALDEAEKRRYEAPSRDVNRGYSCRLSESLGYSLGSTHPPDLVEAFIVGADDVDGDEPYFATERQRSFAPNIWPERPERLRDVVWSYFGAVRELSRTMLDIAALALGVEADFFRARTDKAITTLRCNWYHRRADEVELQPEQMGLGPHTDYGICTILLADPLPGLQVVGRDKQWHDVVPLADGFVVNIGDALAVWTNDEWASTIHRVVPSELPGGTRRRSFAFFQDGNYDALVECLPACCSAEHPAKYQPVTLGQHVLDKILGGRSLTAAGSTQTTGDRLGGPR